MISELFKKCAEQCSIHSISKKGELCLGCSKYDKCIYQHEKIVLFGGESKAKMNFEDFVEVFKIIKKLKFRSDDHGIKLTIDRLYSGNFYPDSDRKTHALSVSFLNFCIRNNIFKNWCIAELKKELNKRFEK